MKKITKILILIFALFIGGITTGNINAATTPSDKYIDKLITNKRAKVGEIVKLDVKSLDFSTEGVPLSKLHVFIETMKFDSFKGMEVQEIEIPYMEGTTKDNKTIDGKKITVKAIDGNGKEALLKEFKFNVNNKKSVFVTKNEIDDFVQKNNAGNASYEFNKFYIYIGEDQETSLTSQGNIYVKYKVLDNKELKPENKGTIDTRAVLRYLGGDNKGNTSLTSNNLLSCTDRWNVYGLTNTVKASKTENLLPGEVIDITFELKNDTNYIMKNFGVGFQDNKLEYVEDPSNDITDLSRHKIVDNYEFWSMYNKQSTKPHKNGWLLFNPKTTVEIKQKYKIPEDFTGKKIDLTGAIISEAFIPYASYQTLDEKMVELSNAKLTLNMYNEKEFLAVDNYALIDKDKNETDVNVTAEYNESTPKDVNNPVKFSDCENTDIATVELVEAKDGNATFKITGKKPGKTTFTVTGDFIKSPITKTVTVEVKETPKPQPKPEPEKPKVPQTAGASVTKTCASTSKDKLGRVTQRKTCYHNNRVERITKYQYKGNSKNYSKIVVNYYSYKKANRKVKEIVYDKYLNNSTYLNYKVTDRFDDSKNRLTRVRDSQRHSNKKMKKYTDTIYQSNGKKESYNYKTYDKKGYVTSKKLYRYFAKGTLRDKTIYSKYKKGQFKRRDRVVYQEGNMINYKDVRYFDSKQRTTLLKFYKYNAYGKLATKGKSKATRTTTYYKKGKVSRSVVKTYK